MNGKAPHLLALALVAGASLLAGGAAAEEERPKAVDPKPFAIELFDSAFFWQAAAVVESGPGTLLSSPSPPPPPARLRIRPVIGGGAGVGLVAIGAF
jgi:hypothetical protein